MKKCSIFKNKSANSASNDKFNQMFNQFILSGFNLGVSFTIFKKVIFSIFHKRKMHNNINKIQAIASHKINFGYYPRCHQWHGGGTGVTESYETVSLLG